MKILTHILQSTFSSHSKRTWFGAFFIYQIHIYLSTLPYGKLPFSESTQPLPLMSLESYYSKHNG